MNDDLFGREDFVSPEFEERESVELKNIFDPGPSTWTGAIWDGAKVGFDYGLTKTLYDHAQVAGLSELDFYKTFSIKELKERFDLDSDRPMNAAEAIISSEMKKAQLERQQIAGRHTGVNGLWALGGTLAGGILDPVAIASGPLVGAVARVASSGAKATYLATISNMTRAGKNASKAIPAGVKATKGADYVKKGAELKKAIMKLMEPYTELGKAITKKVGPERLRLFTEAGAGNLMEELGVQSIRASQGHRYDLTGLDYAMAVFAPAALHSLGIIHRGARRLGRHVKKTYWDNFNSKADNNASAKVVDKITKAEEGKVKTKVTADVEARLKKLEDDALVEMNDVELAGAKAVTKGSRLVTSVSPAERIRAFVKEIKDAAGEVNVRKQKGLMHRLVNDAENLEEMIASIRLFKTELKDNGLEGKIDLDETHLGAIEELTTRYGIDEVETKIIDHKLALMNHNSEAPLDSLYPWFRSKEAMLNKIKDLELKKGDKGETVTMEDLFEVDNIDKFIKTMEDHTLESRSKVTSSGELRPPAKDFDHAENIRARDPEAAEEIKRLREDFNNCLKGGQ